VREKVRAVDRWQRQSLNQELLDHIRLEIHDVFFSAPPLSLSLSLSLSLDLVFAFFPFFFLSLNFV